RSSGEAENQPTGTKKWPGLGNEVTARLLTVTRKGKVCHLLTSMTDAMRFPGGEMADLYSNRWEIELGVQGDKTDDATEQADAEK
ncbi:transposase InsM3 for IS4, partial [Shigella flexneri 6603-63]